jgi:protein arginine kinase activator
MQRGGAHVGRSPHAPTDPAEVRRRLEAAKAEMAEAVKAEDYEGAARLRDRIRELEGRLG